MERLYAETGFGQSELARNLNTSPQVINNWEARGISKQGAATVQAMFGISVNWLLDGTGEPRIASSAPGLEEGDWADVQGFAQAVGLGAGAEAQEYAETHKLKFKASSLRRKGLRPGGLAVMYGDGESMEPRVKPGDAILFDTADTKVRDGALYVILAHGRANAEYQVKRAMVLDDTVYFAADNPVGDHDWTKPRRQDARGRQIDVIGRVRWIGSWED